MVMNGKERVIAAMEHRPVDRTPVFPVVTSYLSSRVMGVPMEGFAIDPNLHHTTGLPALIERFGFDGVEIPMGAPSGTAERQKVIELDGIRYLADAASSVPFARLQRDDHPIALSTEPFLKNKRDLDKITVTYAEEYERRGCLDSVHDFLWGYGDRVFIAGHAAGQTMNSLAAWRGSDQAMVDLVDDPEFVHAVMERATAMSIEVGKAMIKAGVHGIYIGDAWASASIISPRYYERYCLPYHARAAEAFHQLGAKVYLHICGHSSPILEMMADTGVDAIEPLDLMDTALLADAKRRVGDKVCLKGGVSTSLLLGGSPDEVYQASVDAIEACGPTGYILGSGDDIPRDTPLANVDAMLRAAQG